MSIERIKKTHSGRLLEVDYYPIFENGRRIPTRAPKSKPSTKEQEKYNHNQAVKRTVRLILANFDTGDIIMHPTYEQEKAPQDYDQATRDMMNYIRRVKTKRASELKRIRNLLKKYPNDKQLKELKKKLEAPFKYYISVEEEIYKTGKYAGRSNWHFHLFMTGGIDRDTLEDMWPKGIRVNADRFQPERFGPEAAARYISKNPKGKKRFRHSQNLTKPTVQKPKDGAVTRRGVERIAKERVDDREYWEKKYKGYRFIRCFPRYNEYNRHWYVTVIMYRATDSEKLPEWKIDEWAEDDS